jgi:hypothetical protein
MRRYVRSSSFPFALHCTAVRSVNLGTRLSSFLFFSDVTHSKDNGLRLAPFGHQLSVLKI